MAAFFNVTDPVSFGSNLHAITRCA